MQLQNELTLIFVIMMMQLLNLSKQCGMITHTEISERALFAFEPLNTTVDYKSYLQNNLKYLQAGSPYPDWGYLCNSPAGEASHWFPFISNLTEYIKNNFEKGTDRYQQMIAFLFGVVSHDEADVIWHWGQKTGTSADQGFLHSMSHDGSDCKDIWNSGPEPDCHSVGDEGGDLFLGRRGELTWMNTIWNAPVEDLSKIYNEHMNISEGTSALEITACLGVMFAGEHIERIGDSLIVMEIAKHSEFLSTYLDEWYEGGIDDMSANVLWKWNMVIDNIEYNRSMQMPKLSSSAHLFDPKNRIEQIKEEQALKGGMHMPPQQYQSLLKDPIMLQKYQNLLGLTTSRRNLGENHVQSGDVQIRISPIAVSNNMDKIKEELAKDLNIAEMVANMVKDLKRQKMFIGVESQANSFDKAESEDISFGNLGDNLKKAFSTAEEKVNSYFHGFAKEIGKLAGPILKSINSDSNQTPLGQTTNGQISYSYFGHATTSGDYGKGQIEMFVSAPGFSQHGLPQIGAVYLLPNQNGDEDSLDFSEPYLQGEHYSRFGWQMTTLDMNDDGIDDLVVSAPSYGSKINDHSYTDATPKSYPGRIFIFLGRKGVGILQGSKADFEIASSGLDQFQQSGFKMRSEVCDASGMKSLLIGAPFAQNEKGDQIGRVDVFFPHSLAAFSLQPNQTVIQIQSADITIYGSFNYQWYGYDFACSASNNLLLVGAPGTRPSDNPEDVEANGAVYFYRLQQEEKEEQAQQLQAQSFQAKLLFNIHCTVNQSRFGSSIAFNPAQSMLAISQPSFSYMNGVQTQYWAGAVEVFNVTKLLTASQNATVQDTREYQIKGTNPEARFGHQVVFISENVLLVSAAQYSPYGGAVESGTVFFFALTAQLGLGKNHHSYLDSDLKSGQISNGLQASRFGQSMHVNFQNSQGFIAISAPYMIDQQNKLGVRYAGQILVLNSDDAFNAINQQNYLVINSNGAYQLIISWLIMLFLIITY